MTDAYDDLINAGEVLLGIADDVDEGLANVQKLVEELKDLADAEFEDDSGNYQAGVEQVQERIQELLERYT